ncbi:hypothetical protein MJM43_30320, partial [Salmonella enterica subsp. enterica serovar Montevideo]|nr:hypothetical protein [Salmonella enterica subsp. enterica serovar Montevideo]
SYAFSQLSSNGHIVNNGTVYIDDSVTGSGFIKQSGKTIEGSGQIVDLIIFHRFFLCRLMIISILAIIFNESKSKLAFYLLIIE